VHVLVVTGGHPFDRVALTAMLDTIAGEHDLELETVEHPEAQVRFHPDRLDADAVLAYDMPGIRFTGGEPPALATSPPAAYVEGLHALLDSGTGFVFWHHAIAGWPAWDEYAEIIGGRFHYQPSTLDGNAYPDSGYRFDVTHRVEVLVPEHPVCAGLPSTFEITDELYCFPALEDRLVPLLASGADFSSERFFSADRAIRGVLDTRDGWTHPRGTRLVGWAKSARNSPIVYLQSGDGPSAYASPHLRRLVANALGWTGAGAGREWVASQKGARG
jgi:type 1 glutamine amidotransferase